MQIADSTKQSKPYLRELAEAWLRSRRAMIITGIVIVAAGLALGWHWLSAIGLAPVILSLAPCAAMCALGACAMMKGASSCAKSNSNKSVDSTRQGSAPVQSIEHSDR
jgi:hypothetical protein